MVLALVLWVGFAARASAFNACSAAEVMAQEPNCPNNPTATCIIRSTVTVPTGQSCIFDFGLRPLVIGGAASGVLRFGSSVIGIKAGSFTVSSNGTLEGAGTGAPPNDRGGMVNIETTGAVTLLGSSDKIAIDLRGRAEGGVVVIKAGASISVLSRIYAGNAPTYSAAAGGVIRIAAARDIMIAGKLEVNGGSTSSGGGEIDVAAGGRVDSTGVLDISGSDGGVATLAAASEVVVEQVVGSATGEGASGGRVTFAGDRGVTIKGPVRLNGAGGGCGGSVNVEAGLGSIRINGSVEVEGSSPDGGGGAIEMQASQDVITNSSALLSARGADEGCGGGVCLEARDLDIQTKGTRTIDISGGGGGGDLAITMERHLAIRASVLANGRANGSAGGAVVMEAGEGVTGNLDLLASIDVGGGGCSADLGCGAGGSADMVACNLTVGTNGEINTRAATGGVIVLAARRQLAINGPVTSKSTTTTGPNGPITLRHPIAFPPTLGAGKVVPTPPVFEPMPLCGSPGEESCLIPCPTCGNAVTEFPEACDSAGTPVNCDGCSAYCQAETCDDGLFCTTDTCEPALGCISTEVTAPCTEPSATPTQTATVTATPTVTPTSTRTRTPTITPSPTRTPLCPGDCSVNHGVTPVEIVRSIALINLCAGNSAGCAAVPGGGCSPSDSNGNGVITARELSRIIANAMQFPGGCPP